MDKDKKPIFININAISVVKILLILVLFYVLFLIRGILAILFIALVLASAIDPIVDWAQGKKIPRGISVIFIYLITLFVFASAIVLIIPPITEQVNELSANFPLIIDKVVTGFELVKSFSLQHGFAEDLQKGLTEVSGGISGAAGGVFSTLKGVIGGTVSFFIIMVITFYMAVEEKAIKKIVWSVAPNRYQVYIMGLINRMQQKIGLWLRGQLILSLIIFTLTFVGLSILGVEYALVLAMIAGLTEFVPYLGPTLASIPAIFLAFTQSPMLALFVAALYYIIQLTENNIIVPKLMQKVVGLNPIVSIAVLLIGFEIGGIAGAILSIPVTTAVSVFLDDIFNDRVMVDEPKTETESEL
jgi:predicted PurR-regulated permease PerM